QAWTCSCLSRYFSSRSCLLGHTLEQWQMVLLPTLLCSPWQLDAGYPLPPTTSGFQRLKTLFKRTNPILICRRQPALFLQSAQNLQPVPQLFFRLLSTSFSGNI